MDEIIIYPIQIFNMVLTTEVFRIIYKGFKEQKGKKSGYCERTGEFNISLVSQSRGH
jgi:hypothetical protein